jgi:dTDP-glucose pyrophosphorylase
MWGMGGCDVCYSGLVRRAARGEPQSAAHCGMPLRRVSVQNKVSDSLEHLTIPPDASVLDAIRAVERGERGIVFVCGPERRVLGTVTDGDLRRALIAGAALEGRVLRDVMNAHFVSVPPGADRAHVIDLMLARQVQQIPIVDQRGRLAGLHTMRDILGSAPRPNWAVIMAGGKGTRLRPHTEHLPKPMVRVAGRPILERLVLHLVGHGIQHIYLSVNYLSNVVEEHFGDGSAFGCAITYLREECPLGTGGPLALVPGDVADPLLVMNGDLVTQVDVGRFLDFHRDGGYVASMGLHAHAVELSYGVAEVSGTRLVGLREKPTERFMVNAGLYVVSPKVLRYIPRGEEYGITELFRSCIDDGLAVGAYFIDEDWMDIARPDDLKRANGR